MSLNEIDQLKFFNKEVYGTRFSLTGSFRHVIKMCIYIKAEN